MKHAKWGLLVLAVLSLISPPGVAESETEGAPGDEDKPVPAGKPKDRHSVFFVVVDAMRADHLGCYGYQRDTSPTIDRIARESVFFEHAYTVAPWTAPAMASLFTGRYPYSLFPPETSGRPFERVLPREVETLAELLSSNGYRAVALSDHIGIGPRLGHDRGFERWIEIHSRKWSDVAQVRKVLEELGDDTAFVYLHLSHPHEPYGAPAPYYDMFGPPGDSGRGRDRSKPDGLINRYDGEIRFTDEVLKRILEQLEKHGWLERTYLIVTADHGEGFFEHERYGHGNHFFDEVLRIPLLIRPPGGRERQLSVSRRVSNIDLFATVLDLTGIPSPPNTDSQSLWRHVDGGDTASEMPFFAEGVIGGDPLGAACIWNDYKYIVNKPRPRAEERVEMLFNLDRDPLELENLALTEKATVRKMRDWLDEHRGRNETLRQGITSDTADIDPETRERLKAMGYLE
jgi:arylsulfatase A-like enzyme